jgi:hypothetical protein
MHLDIISQASLAGFGQALVPPSWIFRTGCDTAGVLSITITEHWEVSCNEMIELSTLLTLGNRPLFKQRKHDKKRKSGRTRRRNRDQTRGAGDRGGGTQNAGTAYRCVEATQLDGA